MNTEHIESIVLDCIRRQLEDTATTYDLTKDTPLIGASRIVDSMGLVSLLVDIETVLNEEGVEVTILSENAMSAKISPFRNIGALVRHIEQSLKGSSNG